MRRQSPALASPKPKRAQTIALRIEESIVAGEGEVGDRLGAEAELIERYGVSRSVLREALVLVEGSGLAQVRRGPAGGLYVTAPTRELVAANLQQYLDFVVRDLDEVLDFRAELEGFALTCAIERLDRAAEKRALELLARFSAATRTSEQLALGREMLQWIASAAANPLVFLWVEALSRLTFERLMREGADQRALARQSLEIARLRARQVAAVIAAQSSEAMAANLQVFEVFRLLSQMAREPQDHADFAFAQGSELAGTAGPEKLAARVARALKDRMISNGLKTGAHLGSEVELMAEFGVSRSVVREAIRVLERIGVATTVRGIGGGLRVLAPDARSVVRSACVYLRSVGARQPQIHEAGRLTSLALAQSAAQRVAEGRADDLQPCLASISGLREPSLYALSRAYFNALSEISASRLLGLMLSVTSNLYVLDESETADPLVVQETIPTRLAEVLDAVLAGEPGLARRRMIALHNSGARARSLPLSALKEPTLVDGVSSSEY